MEVKRYKNSKNIMSRYKDSQRIVYSSGEEIIETSDRLEFKHSNKDQTYVIPPEYENRLDLVAYKFYNTTDLWWVIAAASGIYDPFKVSIGTTVRIPPLEEVIGR